jgi:hypothetical protein
MSVQLAMFELDDYVDAGESWTGPCAHCGAEKHPTLDDPWGLDPCLVDYLPDVAHSCCGHGVESKAYVVISRGCTPSQSCAELRDHTVLKGREALDYFRSLGVGPDV